MKGPNSQQQPHPGGPDPEVPVTNLFGSRAMALTLLAVLLAFLILSAGTLLDSLSEWAWNTESGNPRWLAIAIQCTGYVACFVVIGLAAIIPLLWFQSAPVRYGLATVSPMIGWLLFYWGFQITQSVGPLNTDELLQTTNLFLFGVVGGLIPVTLVIWLRRWRLAWAESNLMARPVGIIDLMALATVGAIVFALYRAHGLMSEVTESRSMFLLVMCFYGLVGIVVTSTLLIAMRVVMGPADDRFNAATVSGIVLTIVLAGLGWTIVILVSEGPDPESSPLAQTIVFGASGWAGAALPATSLCVLLHWCGIRLSSTTIQRRLELN